jgi:competence protein ComGC
VRIINSHNRGFTLWKLLGLLVILILLAAIAIPNFVRPRTTFSPNACINNLRLIDSAKQQWAREKGKGPDDTAAASDIQPYLGRGAAGVLPICPVDSNQSFTSSYSINNMATKPTCKILPSNHFLP